MKHLNLVNFVFLDGEGFASPGNAGWPVVVVLWKDDELQRFVSVWEVSKLYKASDRDFVERVWANGETAMMVDQGARILIPTNNGTSSLTSPLRIIIFCNWGHWRFVSFGPGLTGGQAG